MFFKGMKALKVLVLKNVFMSLGELQFLTDPRSLYLENCELENASALGNLKELEILVIHFSDIKKLPYELWELTTLRLLAIWDESRVLIIQNLQPSCLQNLKQVGVEDCLGLQVVFQILRPLHANEENQTSLLSSLTRLELDSLPELKYVWRGPPHLVKLQSLEVIRIERFPKLISLFSAVIAQSLVHLKEILIYHCSELEHIITEAETDDNEVVSNTHFHPLCWPTLKRLKIKDCPRFGNAFPITLAQINVQEMAELEIISCKSLKYVSPITLAPGLPYLESVSIIDCPQLTLVFNLAKGKDGVDGAIALPRLQDRQLRNWIVAFGRKTFSSNCHP
ncbi:hypothetical protein POUND7_006810 [Theobroma cacao]